MSAVTAERLLANVRHSSGAPSARNLIVTVFGDAMFPAGRDRGDVETSELSVATLVELLAGLDVNDRLVRTSLSRLVGDGVLTVRSHGRRSAYRIDPRATGMFEQASARIYTPEPQAWDGEWTLVVVDPTADSVDDRAQLRSQLADEGFALVAPNVLASPTVEPDRAATIATRCGASGFAVVRGPLDTVGAALAPRALAARITDLDRHRRAYVELIERFAALESDELERLSPADAWTLRLVVIATWRRAALADPWLPTALVPDDWPAPRARRVVARVYAAVAAASDRHLTELTGQQIATDPSRLDVPAAHASLRLR